MAAADFFHVHDYYCERIGTELNLWGEPINAITNLAFFIAAYVVYAEAKRRDRLDAPVVTLIVLIACIGTGSTLFHMFATFWALATDVIPIYITMVFYFGLILRYAYGLGLTASIIGACAFVPFAAAMGFLLANTAIGEINAGYVSALLLLIGNAAILGRRSHPIAAWLAAGAAVFAVSITLRTVDLAVCSSFALGTHFLWHILNGVLLATVAVGFVRHGQRQAA